MELLPVRVELGIALVICLMVLGISSAYAESTGKRHLRMLGYGIVLAVTIGFTARLISTRCGGSLSQCPSDFSTAMR